MKGVDEKSTLMTKYVKIFSFGNILLIIISLLTLKYSEYFRGRLPIYPILKFIGWTLFFASSMGSIANTIMIIFFRKINITKKLLWFTLSILPLLYFLIRVF